MEINEILKLAASARVMNELAADGVHVALPLNACDIDMIAFVESRNTAEARDFVPIRIVVLREEAIPRNLETGGFSGLITALVWNRGNEGPVRSFALTSTELMLVKVIDLIDVADAHQPCAETDARLTRGPSLKNALEPYAMSPGKWSKKLTAVIADKSTARSGGRLVSSDFRC
jgi:hypothetical protein